MRELPGKRKGGRTERYCYNGKNQLVRRAAGGDAWDYTYDLQGNLVREAAPEGERQYLYDTENRQIRVLSGGKEIQEERYDGEGMRAGLTVNGKSTFLYVDQRLYAEFDETGADVSRYIWGAMVRCRGGSFMEASSMTQRWSNTICGPDIITR